MRQNHSVADLLAGSHVQRPPVPVKAWNLVLRMTCLFDALFTFVRPMHLDRYTQEKVEMTPWNIVKTSLLLSADTCSVLYIQMVSQWLTRRSCCSCLRHTFSIYTFMDISA